MVCASTLAPCLIRAHASVRPLKRFNIWNRSSERADLQAARLREEGFDITVVANLEAAASKADVILCARISTTPLVCGDWLAPGTHVDLAGAFRPDLRASDDEQMRKARVCVDTRPGAFSAAGDVVQAIAAGALSEADVVADLFELSRGGKLGHRDEREITAFKSVGTAIVDLAAAVHVYENSR